MDMFPPGTAHTSNGNRDRELLHTVSRGSMSSAVVNDAGYGQVSSAPAGLHDIFRFPDIFKPYSSTQSAPSFLSTEPYPNRPRRETHSVHKSPFDQGVARDLSKLNTTSETMPKFGIFSDDRPRFDEYGRETRQQNTASRNRPQIRSGTKEVHSHSVLTPKIFRGVRDTPIYSSIARELVNLNNRAPKGGSVRNSWTTQDMTPPEAITEESSFSRDMAKLSAIAREMRKLNAIAQGMKKATNISAESGLLSPSVDPNAFASDLPNYKAIAEEMNKFNTATKEIVRFKAETHEMTEFNIAALLDPVYNPRAELKADELPMCLNPVCGKRHLISDCDITGPDEARVLTNAFFAKEKAGQKKKRTRGRKGKKCNSS